MSANLIKNMVESVSAGVKGRDRVASCGPANNEAGERENRMKHAEQDEPYWAWPDVESFACSCM